MTIEDYIKQPLELKHPLKWLLKEDITIFEVGAAQAEDTIKYAKLFPKSQIHAFEAFKSNVTKALTNLTKYKVENVTFNNIAVSDKIGISDFYESSLENKIAENSISDGSRSSSLLEPEKHLEYYSAIKFSKATQVKTITLDQYCLDIRIKNIDFLHLDVQGGELLVLYGAKNMISSINIIWLEVSKVDLYKNQPKSEDIHRFMLENNFVLILDSIGSLYGDRLYVSSAFYAMNRNICRFINILEKIKHVFSR